MLHSQQPRIYFVYILECRDGRLYTGITTDLRRRVKEHRGRSAKSKFTRAFPIQRLAAYWRLQCTLSNVLKIERAIKRLPKSGKEALIETPLDLTDILDELGISYENQTPVVDVN